MIKNLIALLFLSLFVLCSCSREKEIVYQTVYPTLPELQSPLILKQDFCKFSLPEKEDKNIVVGFDEKNLKCYIKNKEKEREQKLLYEKFIQEINKERKTWNEKNRL